MTSGGTNTASNGDIDRIVREVMAQLGTKENAASETSRTNHGGAAKHEDSSKKQTELKLTGKVITAAELDSRLDGIKRVVTRRGAVVSPAAWDLLRERKIEVSVADGDGAGPSARLVLAVAETNYETAALERMIRQKGTQIEHLAHTGLISVIDELSDLVAKGGELGLLLTSAAAAALCLANRQAGVRAALGLDTPGVAAAVAGVGANLLIVDPAGKSLFQLKGMATEFLAAGPRGAPAAFANRLR